MWHVRGIVHNIKEWNRMGWGARHAYKETEGKFMVVLFASDSQNLGSAHNSLRNCCQKGAQWIASEDLCERD